MASDSDSDVESDREPESIIRPEIPYFQKSPQELDRLVHALKQCSVISSANSSVQTADDYCVRFVFPIGDLSQTLAGAFETIKFKAGQMIIQAGDEGDYFFMMDEAFIQKHQLIIKCRVLLRPCSQKTMFHGNTTIRQASESCLC